MSPVQIRVTMETDTGTLEMTCDGAGTVLTYTDAHGKRGWMFNDAELTKRILDDGDLTEITLEALGAPRIETT